MQLFRIFLLLFIPLELFCSSPRLIITLGKECDFCAGDLQKKYECILISGTSDAVKAEIKRLDSTSPIHMLILTSPLDDLESFSQDIGYGTLVLNEKYERAEKTLNKVLEYFPLTDADLPHRDPHDIGLIYDLMMKVDAIFKKRGLQYWATAGTLLGAVRHQGFIPWDDDLDVVILEKDTKLFESLKDDLAAVGIELFNYSQFNYYKLFFKDGQSILKRTGDGYFPWTYPFIDVFPYTEKEGKYVYLSERMLNKFPQEYFFKDELSKPPLLLPFGPISIPVPQNSSGVVERMYGAEWKTVGFVLHNHQKEEHLQKIKVDLLDYTPPPYILPKKAGH